MSMRKPLAQRHINSNIDQVLNFSFQKSTQKKPSKQESLQTEESKKRGSKDKQVIDLFLGQLKEHNHEKMIQMFGELRKQNKEKEEKNELLVKQVQELNEQFKQVKLEYGRCLKQKSHLKQQLSSQTRALNIYQAKAQSQQRQIAQLLKKQQESLYYKSQLFDANQKLNQYKKKFLQPDETVQSEKEFRFKEMQWTYEMKLDECEQHIKELEKQNWELNQVKIRSETMIKRLNIQLNQANLLVKRLSQSASYPYANSTHKKNHLLSEQSSQEIEELESQVQSLEKQLSQTIEAYELKIVQLQSEVQLEKFKTQTYAEHSSSLQEKINLIQKDFTQAKSQNLSLQDLLEKQQNKTLDYGTLLKEVLVKLQQLQSENPLLREYSSILTHKIQRISGGKSVTFLKQDTKDFVSITSRSKQSDTYGPNSLIKINKRLKTHQKFSSFLNQDDQSSYRESFGSNYTSIKKTEENGYFSRNSSVLESEISRSTQNHEKLDSKILEQRKQIQNRIREKYMKSRPKALDQKPTLKEQTIQQQPKQSQVSSEEKSPHFKRQDRRSIYLTSEFQQ